MISSSGILRLYLCDCHRRNGIDRRYICRIPLPLSADAGGTHRAKVRTDLPRLPCHGYRFASGIAGDTEYDGCRGTVPVTGQPLPLVSKGGTSTLINCAYIGMILSVSRYTAHLEEQKAHDAQIQMQIETGTATSEAQAAAEPTAQILNSDAKFEDEHDSSK